MRGQRVCAAALAAATLVAWADPGYYVVTPYPDAGVRTLDLGYWTVKMENQPEVFWPELGLRYGLNDYWSSELLVSWIGSSQMPTQVSSWNWQNDFLFTQGQWPIDVALHTQLVRRDDGGRAIEFGPVLQTDVDRTQVNFNVFFDHGWSLPRPVPTQLKYQWQLRYRALRGLHLGAQGFGELGPWNDWLPTEQQSHRAGPALFGNLPLGSGTELDWQTAVLWGKVYGHDARMFTLRAKVAF